MANNTVLGNNCHFDNDVIIGYETGRRIDIEPAIIGHNAHIRSHTVIYCNVRIGDEFETGHNAVIREESVIGHHCSIWNNSVIDYGCRIGNHVRIHSNVYIAQYTIIEDDVFLGPGTTIANDPHPFCTKCMKGPIIKTGVRIGANATILPQLTIGEHSLIGAGSFITHDVPPHTVVYGNSSQQYGPIDSLRCRFDPDRKPYDQGLDIKTREALGISIQRNHGSDEP